MTTFKTCPTCKGQSWLPNPKRGSGLPRTVTCPTCEGSGEVTVVNGRELTPAESTAMAEDSLL